MKKQFFIAVFSLLASLPLFASPDPGRRILDEFNREFPAAESISWARESNYAKANFILAGRRVIAYFSLQEGSLEGSMRDIFYDQLPLSVMTALDKRFSNPVVLYIREITNREGTHYRVRMDHGTKKYIVRVSSDGSIMESEKLK